MASDHLPTDRIRQFMLDSGNLTEQESEHIRGWECVECAETMRQVLTEDRTVDSPADKPQD